MKVLVYPSGYISMVDEGLTNEKSHEFLKYRFSASKKNWFSVQWEKSIFPTGTCGEGCVQQDTGDDACLCSISVSTKAVFEGKITPSRDIILSTLYIGAPCPDVYFSDEYKESKTLAKKFVSVYTRGTDTLDEHTIFVVKEREAGRGRTCLYNRVSTVLVGTGGKFSFRNPPSLMPLSGEILSGANGFSHNFDREAAENEVDALLDHLFYHQNTAPFVAHRLIQRLVTSNPSPRYVQSVVNAFRTGKHGNEVFSGKYGDLLATTVAILTDQEARKVEIEMDPSYGKLREPIVKFIHVLRSLNYTSTYGAEVNLEMATDLLGQQVFESPSVFSFFLPEYTPPGVIGNAGLVSPEMQVATSTKVMGWLNSINSLVFYGLTSCKHGLGSTSTFQLSRQCNSREAADIIEAADGRLHPSLLGRIDQPSVDKIIADMDDLLTAGRLSSESKILLKKSYDRGSSFDNRVRRMLRVLLASSEFHVTNLHMSITDQVRQETNVRTKRNLPYKAVVVLFMKGAVDSFNVLVPHSKCGETGNRNYFQEYADVRTDVALPKESLRTLIPVKNQPCKVFGVHDKLKTLHTLFNGGDASFIANMGALIEPVSKEEFKAKSKQLPPSLFAHNVMQHSMHTVHPQFSAAKGVAGRLANAIEGNCDLFSLGGNVKMLDGSVTPITVDEKSGITRFAFEDEILEAYFNYTDQVSTSKFAETYLDVLKSTLARAEDLGEKLASTKTSIKFPGDVSGDSADCNKCTGNRLESDASCIKCLPASSVSLQLREVSKIMKLREHRKVDKDVFFISQGGFDTHNDGGEKLEALLEGIDTGLRAFVEEMKSQGLWENVTLVTVSDFGRTLTSNGLGTDHAWGGNYFVLGGDVKGSKIHGKFPEKLTEDGDSHIGRGRLIPSMGWEAMWNAVAKWFGVEEARMDTVLPNRKNFPPESLLSRKQMFK